LKDEVEIFFKKRPQIFLDQSEKKLGFSLFIATAKGQALLVNAN
jgi:hypothetical protein